MGFHSAAKLAAALAVSVFVVATSAFADSDNDSGDTRSALRDAVAEQPALVRAFYKARDFKPAWTGDDRALKHGEEARDALNHAEAQGLDGAAYIKPWKKWDAPPDEAQDAARYDIALTRSLMLYANDVHLGRVHPASVYNDVQLPPQDFDLVKEINRALSRSSLEPFLDGLPPPDPAYRALVTALAQYREIADAGGWPVLAKGAKDTLAKRLSLEDPALAKEGDDPDDDDVRDALKRYEARNGLPDTAELTPEAIASLNVPVQTRMAIIAANLERRRWLPRTLEARHIVVDVPDQSVDFVKDGEIVLHSRAIIGKRETPTPILRTEVTALVLNPPWDIPDFIAAKSLLPHLKKNHNYLASRNFVLAGAPQDDPQGKKIDWRKVTAKSMPYQIQQLPGGDNALGALMLDMPNDFDVYLHDTPMKAWFAEQNRARSNGCVRVEKITALASLVQGNNADETEELERRIGEGVTLHLTLDDPVPVYMVYWTALPQPDGTVGFRSDLYGRDKILMQRLSGAAEKVVPTKKKTA